MRNFINSKVCEMESPGKEVDDLPVIKVTRNL